MMEEIVIQTDESYDSTDDQSCERPTERWAPLGASSQPSQDCKESCFDDEAEKLHQLEEEQEQLNSSLLALTTHFAQVQFRLKQIVAASPQDKETLLKDLEEFAFRGCPDVRGFSVPDSDDVPEDHEEKMEKQRQKQQELILQLKKQLEDLEEYAYLTGDAGPPSSKVMEKQRVLIDQLKNKLDLNLDEFDKLSPDDLRHQVDHAIGQLVNPVKAKEQLVAQLKTQIVDLERFIEFLQGEATSPGPLGKSCKCKCSVHNKHSSRDSGSNVVDLDCCTLHNTTYPGLTRKENSAKLRNTTIHMMKRALTLLQMFAVTQFGCGSEHFQRNLLKKTMKGNHWGDLRARLEIAVDKVVELASNQDRQTFDSDYTSDSEDSPVISCDEKLTSAVRKDLAMSLRDLMQHGLIELSNNTSLVPLGCLPLRSASLTKTMHAWELILKYYETKHGKQYNSSPARKLSQSFKLDMIGGTAITAKQALLSAIDTIIETHVPLKRSTDSQMKAFVCLALNEKRLITWLRLIFRAHKLIETYYQPWSYVVKTGFDDALRSFEKFNQFHFDLPVDLAVRPFQNIKDAF